VAVSKVEKLAIIVDVLCNSESEEGANTELNIAMLRKVVLSNSA
jgi:hypothetical protein